MPRKYEVGDNSGLNITRNLEQQQQALYSFTQRFWKKKKEYNMGSSRQNQKWN